MLNDQRGGHRLIVALGLAALVLGGFAGGKMLLDLNSAKAQVVTPVDLGLGAKVVDNPPVGIGGGEPPPKPDTAAVVVPATPATDTENKSAPEPEVIKPCGFIDKKLCLGAKLLEMPNALGEVVTYIGLQLPAGKEIRTHRTGQVTRVEINQPSSFKGFEASILDPNSATSGTVYVPGDTTNPPWEGRCSTNDIAVQCGFGGLPSCGQEACGPLPPPPPPSPLI